MIQVIADMTPSQVIGFNLAYHEDRQQRGTAVVTILYELWRQKFVYHIIVGIQLNTIPLFAALMFFPCYSAIMLKVSR